MPSENSIKLSRAIVDKHLEVKYNAKEILTPDFKVVKLNLKGKIKCPVLNTHIAPIVCSKLMDSKDWPRGINPDICKECNCYINSSISKFKKREPNG